MIVDDELIAKYLSGDASPEEAMALHEWLEVQENKIRFEEMEKVWIMAHPSKAPRAVNTQEAWRKVKPARSMKWTAIGIAASILLLISIGYLIFQYSYWSSQPGLSKIVTGDSTRQVTLADNSQVTLYRNSEIFVFDKYDDAVNRPVMLKKGEAFFSVTKDPQKPFIVLTSFAQIRVVGTEFNVIIRGDGVEVGVDEGVVLVSTDTDSVYVRKGSTTVIKSGQTAATQEMDANTWAYATQRLVFKDTPMSEVIKAVEKTYACTISVSNDNIKNCRLNASFDKDSVDKIVLLISESLNLKVEQNGQVFTLDGEGCP